MAVMLNDFGHKTLTKRSQSAVKMAVMLNGLHSEALLSMSQSAVKMAVMLNDGIIRKSIRPVSVCRQNGSDAELPYRQPLDNRCIKRLQTVADCQQHNSPPNSLFLSSSYSRFIVSLQLLAYSL